MLNLFHKLFRWIKRIIPQKKLGVDYFVLQQKLHALQLQVENNALQLEQAKASFLKNIYHEIRTPLNSIMGFTNLLVNKEFEKDSRNDYLRIIDKSSADFLRVMDDIIKASLLDAGMVAICPEEVQMSEFFAELGSVFSNRKHALEKYNIALLPDLGNDLQNKTVNIDRLHVTQILKHLLENALKYTEKGVIEYGCHNNSGNLLFYVKDSGTIALSENDKEIYERFHKNDYSDKNTSEGLGLGLSICKELVELMNGFIWHESNVGAGSVFYVSLPIANKNVKLTGRKKNKVKNKIFARA